MRVLVISDYDDNLNAVRPEGTLFIGLHKAGVAIQIMTYGHCAYADQFRAAGVPIIDFHPSKKFDKASVDFIRKVLIKEDIQILHLFNNKAIINGIKASKGLGVKVLTYRGYTGNIHWWDPSCYLTHLHPRVNAISCVSDAVKAVFDQQLFFPKGKAVTVSKGHDPAWYQDVQTADLREFNFPEDAIIVSVVANARRMKGIPYLLEALKYLSKKDKLYFLLIGRGLDDKKNLQSLEKIGWKDRFVFAGFRKDVLSLVKACDLSLLPSVKGEGLSKVLLESLFLARPTIMTNIDGNKGLAIHNKTGMIIPPRDPKAMATVLEKLEKDEALRKQLGIAGQQYVSTHYTVDRSVQEMLDLYQKVLQP